MPRAIFDPVSVGDQRPISIRVNPTDAMTATGATYTITRRKDPKTFVWDPGGACIVTNDNFGTVIRTPDLIDFATADTYYVNFVLNWADGQITQVTALVPVLGDCNC